MDNDDDLVWLKQAVSKGLSGMVVLHLDGGPASETIQKTAGVWFYVMKSWPIAWNESLDKPRISAAFTLLASQSSRWPAPADLRKLLPRRVYPQPALDAPEYPQEKQKRNQAALKQIRKLAEKRADLIRRLIDVTEPAIEAQLKNAIAEIEQQQREVYTQ